MCMLQFFTVVFELQFAVESLLFLSTRGKRVVVGGGGRWGEVVGLLRAPNAKKTNRNAVVRNLPIDVANVPCEISNNCIIICEHILFHASTIQGKF